MIPEGRMNWIASIRFFMPWLAAFSCAACGMQVADPQTAPEPLSYRVDYIIEPRPGDGMADVTMRVRQSRALLRELRLRMDSRYSGVRADGQLSVEDGVSLWNPPASGGSISWQVSIPHRRNGNGYDAWLAMDFGLFRAEDVVPRASSRTAAGAHSETWLAFKLPPKWSVVTQYAADNGRIRVDNPARRFDQPTGWMVMGDLGVRRELIGGMHVAVAGPVGHSVRRLDTLALLHWTLPELARVVPELPPRLTIISAGEPMWRGGLSAPQSLFLHAGRPLISENATSTLLHELMHMSLRIRAHDGYDWIVEGFAEYYSLQLLHRSGTISDERYSHAVADLAEWATQADTLCTAESSGATTALAVGILASLNDEILTKSAGESSLDNVAHELAQIEEPVDVYMVAELVEDIIGDKPDTLHIARLPGCRSMASARRVP
jgi:hypothetical protein